MGAQAAEVDITIYYEVLCPDSIYYQVTQVKPAWEKFGDQIRFEFKPFGIANFTMGPEGSWVFACQHGPDECYGNMMHACITKLVSDESSLVPLLNCVMAGSPASLTQVEFCNDDIETKLDMTELYQCINLDGPDLLHEVGVETFNLQPRLTSVPWTLFNNVFVEEDSRNSQKDLVGVLCDKYLAGNPACP